jgi:hypothetical protein
MRRSIKSIQLGDVGAHTEPKEIHHEDNILQS